MSPWHCEWLINGLPAGTWGPFLFVVAIYAAITLFCWIINADAHRWLDDHGQSDARMPEDDGDEVSPERFRLDRNMRL